MITKLHGDDWSNWIYENVSAGCSPMDMYKSMLSVWGDADAKDALETAFGKRLNLGLPSIPNQSNISVDDITIHVSMRSENPYVCLLDGVLTEEECDEILEIASQDQLQKSGVVDASSGDSITHPARTSTGMCFPRGSNPYLDKIENRLANLTGWPELYAEGLQLLKYEIGQEYRPHHDWFDTVGVGGAKHLERGGQRVATTILYLKTPDDGGATIFPDIKLQVSPKKGSAVFFRNVNNKREPVKETLHGGAPVAKGSKVILTYWQRENEFV